MSSKINDMYNEKMSVYSDENPYAFNDPTQQMSWWNRFTDSLGFTNHAGQARYENSLLADQWQSQYDLEQTKYQREVQAMHSAGLNPDFQNMSGLNSPDTSPTNESGARMNTFGTFLQTMGILIQSAIGIATGVTQIQGTRLASDMSALGQALPGVLDSVAGSVATGLVGAGPETKNRLSKALTNGRIEVDVDTLTSLASSSVPRPRTRRARKALEWQLRNYFTSADFQKSVFEKVKTTNESAMQAVESYSSNVGRMASSEDDIADVLADISGILFKADLENARGDYYEARGRRQYAQTFDYVGSAASANYVNTEKGAASDFQTTINSTLRDIASKLEHDVDTKKGPAKLFASALLVLMATQLGGQSRMTISPIFNR